MSTPCARCGLVPATESGVGHTLLCRGYLTKRERTAKRRACPICGLTQYEHHRGDWRHLAAILSDPGAFDAALAAHEKHRAAIRRSYIRDAKP